MTEPERRSSDGLTPRERMEARGFEFDEHGNTVEIGYGPETPSEVLWELDRDAWCEKNKPALTVACKSMHQGKRCGQVIGRVWKGPGGGHWLVGQHVTSPDVRLAQMERIHALHAEGAYDWLASGMNKDLEDIHPAVAAMLDMKPQTSEEIVARLVDEVDLFPVFEVRRDLADYRLPGIAPGVLLGCDRNGNVRIHVDYLAELADSTRRELHVEMGTQVGYPSE